MFEGTAKPLSDSGLSRAANDLRVQLPALWAVMTVETRGCGFLPDRRPQILFDLPKETAVDVNRIADDLASASARTLKDVKLPSGALDPDRIQKLEAELKAVARLEFLKLRRPPPRLLVLVTTPEIREAGPSEVVTRLKLKITEQAVEWTTIESEGQTRDRLVPE